MRTTYVLYDHANRRMETFAGPHRLAKWSELPEEWSIEEFLGIVSRGMVSLEYVKQHAEDEKREISEHNHRFCGDLTIEMREEPS